MRKLHSSIAIRASRERVWKVLWDDATFRDWASVFMEESYKTAWKEGGLAALPILLACPQ